MLYRGEQYDSNLGLYYLRARYYNPATGRFMSRDPNAGLITIPITLHKYIYAGDNPISWKDPSGRDIIEDTLILDTRSLSAVDYLNSIGCFGNIGLTAITTMLSERLDYNTALGVAGAVYGCITLEPSTTAQQWAKSGVDVGACAYSALQTITDANQYFDNPTAINETRFVVDATGELLGCGITGLEAVLGP